MPKKFVACSIKQLPEDEREPAALFAIDLNPANRSPVEQVGLAVRAFAERFGVEDIFKTADAALNDPVPDFLAVLTTKYFGSKGVRLSASFMDNPNAATRDKILAHMNAWGEFCNVRVEWSQSQGQIRINRGPGGFWSYLGTDVLRIAAGEPTMNLQGFTERTSDAEYRRVVRHEMGHTLGFPHEHMRRDIINRLDANKVIEYFRRTQGWGPATTRSQVLTPLEDGAIMGTEVVDDDSIMCYQLPGSITRDGKPIPGGDDINSNDRAFAAKIYPLETTPPVPASGVVRVDTVSKTVFLPQGWSLGTSN